MRLVLPLCLLIAASASADVYRTVDANGVVHYSDKPQSPNDKPVALPPLQTYKHDDQVPAASLSAPDNATAPRAAAAPMITIVQPAAEDTIRDAERNVPVTVETVVGEGQGLVYYLDGAAQNAAPTPSTAFLMTNVERGQHALSVALVQDGGKEVARSPAITFYMMPPLARH